MKKFALIFAVPALLAAMACTSEINDGSSDSNPADEVSNNGAALCSGTGVASGKCTTSAALCCSQRVGPEGRNGTTLTNPDNLCKGIFRCCEPSGASASQTVQCCSGKLKYAGSTLVCV